LQRAVAADFLSASCATAIAGGVISVVALLSEAVLLNRVSTELHHTSKTAAVTAQGVAVVTALTGFADSVSANDLGRTG
jgi:hypothetical protein